MPIAPPTSSSLRFLSILYSLEAGLVLLVAPWRPIWDRVLAPSSELWSIWTSPWVRAGVTALGAILLVSFIQQIQEWRRARADR